MAQQQTLFGRSYFGGTKMKNGDMTNMEAFKAMVFILLFFVLLWIYGLMGWCSSGIEIKSNREIVLIEEGPDYMVFRIQGKIDTVTTDTTFYYGRPNEVQ